MKELGAPCPELLSLSFGSFELNDASLQGQQAMQHGITELV
jgi:hypothetical protein